MYYSIFQQYVNKTPDNLALTTYIGEQFSYSELDHHVSNWAAYFYNQGLRPGNKVSVITKHEEYWPVIMLALHKLHAIYAPQSAHSPIQQIKNLLSQSPSDMLVIDEDLQTQLNLEHNNIHLINTDLLIQVQASHATMDHLTEHFEPSRPAYEIASSGSTGVPKLMQITHAALLRWLPHATEQLHLSAAECFAATIDPGYDASIAQAFFSWLQGGRLHIVGNNRRRDIQEILYDCSMYQVKTLLLITTILNRTDLEPIIIQIKASGVEKILVTGEACSIALKHLCEKHELELYNCYGPTEACFGCFHYLVNGLPDDNGFVPIGFPNKQHHEYLIIDERLWIISKSLISGYINNPEATEKNFKRFTLTDGRKVTAFDTGNGVEIVKGQLYCRGRVSNDNDVHIKSSGVKVYPSAVETIINDYRTASGKIGIIGYVCVSEWDGKPKLIAHVQKDKDLDLLHFKHYLHEHLKSEEWPIMVIHKEPFTLLVSGKIDRKALINKPIRSDEFLFCEESSEQVHNSDNDLLDTTIQKLKAIWCNLLNLQSVNINTEFNLYGGTSNTLPILVKRINDKLDREIRLLDIIRLPKITIASIAQMLDKPKTEDKAPVIITPMKEGFLAPTYFLLPPIAGNSKSVYPELVTTLLENFPVNVMAATLSALYNGKPMTSYSAIATAYADAIQRNQPQGPYHLIGFSFGCTLAYMIAEKLQNRGQTIADIHLIDGLPPTHYQQLSAKHYYDYLKGMIDYFISILQAKHHIAIYNPMSDASYAALAPRTQVDKAFKDLLAQIVEPTAKRLLLIIMAHMKLILNANHRPNKVLQKAEVYFSQELRNGLLTTASQIERSGWSEYFLMVNFCGDVIPTSHIGLLERQATESFWQTLSVLRDSASTLINFQRPSSTKKENDAVSYIEATLLNCNMQSTLTCRTLGQLMVENLSTGAASASPYLEVIPKAAGYNLANQDTKLCTSPAIELIFRLHIHNDVLLTLKSPCHIDIIDALPVKLPFSGSKCDLHICKRKNTVLYAAELANSDFSKQRQWVHNIIALISKYCTNQKTHCIQTDNRIGETISYRRLVARWRVRYESITHAVRQHDPLIYQQQLTNATSIMQPIEKQSDLQNLYAVITEHFKDCDDHNIKKLFYALTMQCGILPSDQSLFAFLDNENLAMIEWFFSRYIVNLANQKHVPMDSLLSRLTLKQCEALLLSIDEKNHYNKLEWIKNYLSRKHCMIATISVEFTTQYSSNLPHFFEIDFTRQKNFYCPDFQSMNFATSRTDNNQNTIPIEHDFFMPRIRKAMPMRSAVAPALSQPYASKLPSISISTMVTRSLQAAFRVQSKYETLGLLGWKNRVLKFLLILGSTLLIGYTIGAWFFANTVIQIKVPGSDKPIKLPNHYPMWNSTSHLMPSGLESYDFVQNQLTKGPAHHMAKEHKKYVITRLRTPRPNQDNHDDNTCPLVGKFI